MHTQLYIILILIVFIGLGLWTTGTSDYEQMVHLIMM